MSTAPVYFYPHAYLRDRQLDTIRHWPGGRVLNPEIVEGRAGAQVTRERSLRRAQRLSWKQRLPLPNVKRRPPGLAPDVPVYVWGALMATGPFMVDLDNPYALTAYNIRAMALYRGAFRRALESPRCLAIHCMSAACRESLRLLFGEAVYRKAAVRYPRIQRMVEAVPPVGDGCRFLFVGTQFEIKGGAALLRAFRRVHSAEPGARLDVITHLPEERASLAADCPGITVHEARFARAEIADRFMRTCDVLVHPTYIDSFGMVVLEGLAHGMAVVATDVYAIREMVEDGVNGILLEPPICNWNGVLPSRHYYDWPRFKDRVLETDTAAFEDRLADAMLRLARDPGLLRRARAASLELLERRFLERRTG